MISIRFVCCISLYIIIPCKTQDIAVPTEDLVDEYYTTILEPNDNYLPQDERDAQDIMNSSGKEDVIAGILAYRDKIRRFAINQRILSKIAPFVSDAQEDNSHGTRRWVFQRYHPQRSINSTITFMDLCFGLLEDENVVLGQYLENFFDKEDETWIIIGMVITKDMGAMISTYDKNHDKDAFKGKRNGQKHPFKDMLKVWARYNHEPIETGGPNMKDVKKDADILKEEYDKGNWHEKKRDQLELILMKKSIKYAREVIAEFEKAMGDKKLENIINDNIHIGCKMNRDLADAYASLARYVKYKYTYIADILRTYSDGSDHWAAWIMCIAVVHPQEWSKVDQAFQKDHKDDSLSKFILNKLTDDKVMAEMIALIVDPNFKPTKFSEKANQGGSLPIPAPPPVPATVATPKPPETSS